MKKRRIRGVCGIKCVEMYGTNHSWISCHAAENVAIFIDLPKKSLSQFWKSFSHNVAPCTRYLLNYFDWVANWFYYRNIIAPPLLLIRHVYTHTARLSFLSDCLPLCFYLFHEPLAASQCYCIKKYRVIDIPLQVQYQTKKASLFDMVVTVLFCFLVITWFSL